MSAAEKGPVQMLAWRARWFQVLEHEKPGQVGEIQAVEGVVWSWGACWLSRAETWGAGPRGLRATAH